MGCLFGGLLAEKGLNVILIDVWKEHVDAINKHDLKNRRSLGCSHRRDGQRDRVQIPKNSAFLIVCRFRRRIAHLLNLAKTIVIIKE